MDVCASCKGALKKKLQPLDALANFQYYARQELPADVRLAFEKASLYDLMMVARNRATRITHMFCEKPSAKGFDKIRAFSQGYSKGNVAIFAQDIVSVRPMLPPPAAEIKEAMCALFIGPSTTPTRDNIRELKPVLVSKTRVQKMIEFLLTHNPQYMSSGVQFSQHNLDALFPETDAAAFPSAIEICTLADGKDPIPASYADRGGTATNMADVEEDDGTLVLDAVGFTVGENTPRDHRDMKAGAVAWCLDKKNFIKMQTGSNFISDRDPGLLTFTFPALDPWGIGGFHEPNRTDQQHITFERQVKNLLLQHDRWFQKDPNFAYVCWNIMQKKKSKTWVHI
ncbi:hypothetical protein B0H16DRAFT_1432312 [Mycena metata]|uniref:DUF6570 domain-containing protein n=1 Tax=Mycena metata TaxID=1033252 RepID=A0AAD7MKJ8_9AGAR|nr:hypothetical protein B0H16DRAFT_1432312 [Mycena metata]